MNLKRIVKTDSCGNLMEEAIGGAYRERMSMPKELAK